MSTEELPARNTKVYGLKADMKLKSGALQRTLLADVSRQKQSGAFLDKRLSSWRVANYLGAGKEILIRIRAILGLGTRCEKRLVVGIRCKPAAFT